MGYNDYIGKARDIQSGLSGPLFTTIVPTPGEVIPLIDQLQGLWTQTQLGNKIVVPERDALRAAITALLVKQGLAVNYLADGDLSILVQSGFDITKTAEQKEVPAKGKVLSIESKPGGEAIIDGLRIEGTDWYQVRVTGPNNFVKWQTGKYARFKMADLPVGVTLQAEMRAVNYRGQGEWSLPLGFVAQISPSSNNNTTVNTDSE